ncbi:MAG: CapA family protein [Acidimicrobiales bacterium]
MAQPAATTVTVALAGDTMLGRGVGSRLRSPAPGSLFSPEVVEVAGEADVFVADLECCISERGERWPDPAKPFFFRAPPAAAEALAHLGVDCVTLANNHALDYGPLALLDTLDHLRRVGIGVVGAGASVEEARRPATLTIGGFRLGVMGLTDHPADYAAGPRTPGVAYADLRRQVPAWVRDGVGDTGADAVLVSPHWGPNMTRAPVAHVVAAARVIVEAGATLVAGHSAHVFHGVAGRVLFDLGDFIDDYAVEPELRNDLGLLWLVTVGHDGPVRLEAVPLRLDLAHTRLAEGEDAAWIRRRFRRACAELGTDVHEHGGRLVVAYGDMSAEGGIFPPPASNQA